MEMICSSPEEGIIYRKQVATWQEAEEQLEKGENGWYAIVRDANGKVVWFGVREVGVASVVRTGWWKWESVVDKNQLSVE